MQLDGRLRDHSLPGVPGAQMAKKIVVIDAASQQLMCRLQAEYDLHAIVGTLVVFGANLFAAPVAAQDFPEAGGSDWFRRYQGSGPGRVCTALRCALL